ncbi:hypothetical protein M0R04_10390 [Candidatus Dojkabacteria bacterium]|jgi:predicted nucleic-acid-binding Zn-ribbon protein|nr:hypothetical protein [Candidatus Dojkabacteria bacterium]
MIYNKNTKCPKCGGIEISTKYVEHEILGGQIKRVCFDCQFAWYEEPLDKKK